MFKLALFLVYVFYLTSAYAVDCPELNSPEAVVQCALLRHPDIAVSEAGINQSIKLERFARQVPNPEFDMRSTYGETLGDKVVTTELNFAFVLQLGGKRRARIQQAWAEQAEASASLLKTKEDIYISTMASLIRARQLDEEIRSIDHAVEAFGEIVRLYKAYGKLSPEQQISLNIFQLAQGDYRARKVTALLEQQTYARNLELALGEPIKFKSSLYPKPLRDWPKLEMNENLSGSGIRLAEADLNRAQADLKAAQADSWPDLRVGPSSDRIVEGPFSYQSFGFNVSLPIPFFNINQGGRAYANAGVMRSQANLNAEKSKLLNSKGIFINQYNSMIEALRLMPSVEMIESKHKGAEGYFHRGLLSTSLMVEYHRQIVDLIIAKNELELGAVEALWRVYAIEGKIFPDMKSAK